MRKQHGIRRWLLGALMVLAVASAALGSGHGASAEGKPRPDYGSKTAFKLECELLGGTFIDDGISTVCFISGVGSVVCDANGNNCTSHTAGRPGGGANSPDGTGEQNAPDEGGTGYPGTGGRPGQTSPDTLPNLPGAND